MHMPFTVLNLFYRERNSRCVVGLAGVVLTDGRRLQLQDYNLQHNSTIFLVHHCAAHVKRYLDAGPGPIPL